MHRVTVLGLVLTVGCKPAPEVQAIADPVADLPALRAADSAWNQSSLAKVPDRMAAHYAANARADFPGPEPIRGQAAIREAWTQVYADTAFRLEWTMERAEIVPGTALGYTIGRWHQHTAASDSTGPYVAVWQKRPDGRWLVLIDTAR